MARSIPFDAPIYEQAVVAKSKVDEDKMGPALQRVAVSDPAFQFHREPETSTTSVLSSSCTVRALRMKGNESSILPFSSGSALKKSKSIDTR